MSTTAATSTTLVQTQDVSPLLKKVIYSAIERAQRKLPSKDGVFYLDFQREIDATSLPDQFMDIEIHIDTNLIDLVKCDEIYFTPDFTQYSTTVLDGYKKWSDLQTTCFNGYCLNEINVF